MRTCLSSYRLSKAQKQREVSQLYGIVELGGPEQFRFDEFISRGLNANKDPREVEITGHV